MKKEIKSLKVNNLGFTLIELLASMIILGIITVIAVQTYYAIIENNDESKYNYYMDLVKEGANLYFEGQKSFLKNGECLTVTYQTLLVEEKEEEDVKEEYDIVVDWKYVGTKTKPESFPTKESGYNVSDITCDNATATWNDYTWEIEIDFDGYQTVCMVSVDDGNENPMTEELETKEEELKICQNEITDLTDAKTHIVNGINGAFPGTVSSRVTTSSTWQDLATYISSKMYKYQTTQTGSESFNLDGSSSGDNRTATGTIKFPTAYSYIPIVVASASHAQHAQCSLSISNIKEESFNYSIKNTAAGRGTCTINWFSY